MKTLSNNSLLNTNLELGSNASSMPTPTEITTQIRVDSNSNVAVEQNIAGGTKSLKEDDLNRKLFDVDCIMSRLQKKLETDELVCKEIDGSFLFKVKLWDNKSIPDFKSQTEQFKYYFIDSHTKIVSGGRIPDPTVTFTLKLDTLLDIFQLNTSTVGAFMQGKVKIDGNLMTAKKLKILLDDKKKADSFVNNLKVKKS